MNRRSVSRRRVRAQRTYRLLVRLYPSAHRRAFGEQMLQTFGDHYRDVIEDRRGSAMRFWLGVLADTAISLRTEHAAELRARRRGAGGTPHRHRDGVPVNGPHRPTEAQATARSLLRTPSSIFPATRDRGHVRERRAIAGRQRSRMNRSTRVRRRLRYRRSAFRPVRVLIRTRHHQLVYRGRLAALPVMLMLAGAALGVGAATAHIGMSAFATGLVVAAWLGFGMRLSRPVPAGPHGDGPTPPGGAGVREPRRPRPMSPTGSAARPRLEHDSPGQAAALI